jgi:hypothetical protein
MADTGPILVRPAWRHAAWCAIVLLVCGGALPQASGELLVREFREALAAVQPHLEPGEWTGRVSGQEDRRHPEFGYIKVQTTSARDRYAGRVFVLEKSEQGLKVVVVFGWLE